MQLTFEAETARGALEPIELEESKSCKQLPPTLTASFDKLRTPSRCPSVQEEGFCDFTVSYKKWPSQPSSAFDRNATGPKNRRLSWPGNCLVTEVRQDSGHAIHEPGKTSPSESPTCSRDEYSKHLCVYHDYEERVPDSACSRKPNGIVRSVKGPIEEETRNYADIDGQGKRWVLGIQRHFRFACSFRSLYMGGGLFRNGFLLPLCGNQHHQ